VFRTIIFATDGSAAAERVLLYAEHMGRIEGAHIVVVHAYELPQVYGWTDGYEELVSQLERVATEAADDAVRVLQKSGLDVVADVRQGQAAEVALQAARDHNADLIIMGRSQKRDNMAEVILGSVSASVLRYALCPVLVVP
jgi:nucleotide-binding universal stress UspA family protein